MATSATFVIIIPFLIAVIVFIVVVATRSGRHKHRGANDARNFDDGTTFYPGDAVVNPTSTPPPHEHSGAAVPPQSVEEATAHPSESGPAAPLTGSNPGEIVSDGLMPKGEQSAFKSGRQDPDTSGDPDSITSKARGAARGEETAGGGPEGGGGGTTGGSR